MLSLESVMRNRAIDKLLKVSRRKPRRRKRRKVDPALRRRMLRLLRRAGVPYDARRNKMWFDGKVTAAGPKLPVEDAVHEAAHWLVADAKCRKTVNFGLGLDPNSDTPEGVDSPELQRPNDGDDDEILASGGGILLFAMIGGRYWKVLADHQWGVQCKRDELEDLVACRRALEKAGVRVSDDAYGRVRRTLARWVREYMARCEERST